MSKTIYHNHHITPRCLLKHKSKEFIDHPSNIIRVTTKYHIKLHKWLFMLTGNIECECAYKLMKHGNYVYDWTGRTHSEKTKRKMSASKSGKNNPNFDMKLSIDHKLKISISCTNPSLSTRKKMSDAHIGMKHTQNTIQKMKSSKVGRNNPRSKKWVINGKLFHSSYEAGLFMGMSRSYINKICNNNLPLCYSF